MTTHTPTEPHGTCAMGDGDTVTVGALVSAMTPVQVETIAVACMAALERRPGCAGRAIEGEYADLGLRREALEYARKRDVAATNWMTDLGIERDLTGIEMLGVTRAATEGRGWIPQPDGRPVVTLPIWSGECCLDILALCPKDANKWWCRTDIVPVLDHDEIGRCVFFDEPLHIHANPLTWLRAGATGAVVLDWRSAVFYLTSIRRFLCHDQLTAKRLDQALRHPPPKFQIKLAKEPINAAA